MPDARPRRSALYMPASNARALEKARSLPCDVVIIDLEDAVAPDAKAEARALAVETIRAGGFGSRELVLRVNGADTPWGADDVEAAKAAKPDAVLIPKVSTPDDLARYAAALSGAAPLWAMIETCKAILKLDDLAAAAGNVGVTAWVMGTNDLAKEMRCPLTPERTPILPALALSVTAARAYGLTILDGVFNEIGDEPGLVSQCAQAASFGFDGKTLIHPTQVEAANRAFTPDDGAVEWARTVVAAFARPENAGQGVLKVDGRMVERLHLAEAKRLLAVAEAISRHGEVA
jgi:citrate lyase subunit beta/citryl-CoA lyase